MLKLPEKCFQLLLFRMKALHGIFPGLKLCTQQEGSGERWEAGWGGEKDGWEDKTLVYLHCDAMLENTEKSGHCKCKKGITLSSSQEGF